MAENKSNKKKLTLKQMIIDFNAGWVGGVINCISGHPIE